MVVIPVSAEPLPINEPDIVPFLTDKEPVITAEPEKGNPTPAPPPEPNPLLTAEADIKLSCTKDAVNACDAVAGCSTLPESSVVTTLPFTSFIRLRVPPVPITISAALTFLRLLLLSLNSISPDPAKVEAAFASHSDAKILAFVHAETSTGVRSDAKTLCQIAQAHDALTIVDTVTSLAGSELKVAEWGIDAVYSGTQKCLSCPPGISPVSFSKKAVAVIENRKTPTPSWFLDQKLVMGYWGGGAKRAYHHTAPVNALYAFHESLVVLEEEGLENAWARHQMHHNALRDGLEAMGISFLVDQEYRLPQLNSVMVPAGIDEAEVRRRRLADYSLGIGAGLGALAGKVWRIGLMGHACNKKNVLLCLSALENTLAAMDADIITGKAIAAAEASYSA